MTLPRQPIPAAPRLFKPSAQVGPDPYTASDTPAPPSTPRMSRLAYLRSIYNNLLDEVEKLTVSTKANYAIDGQSVAHSSHLDMLMRKLADMEELLAKAGDPEFAPSTIRSRGIPR
jgi:hypothetical protein